MNTNFSCVSRCRRFEWFTVGLVFVLITAVLSVTSLHRWPAGQMDNTLLVSALGNIKTSGVPLIDFTGVREAINIAAHPIEETCSMDLAGPSQPYDNLLRTHTYVILYALAPFTFVFSPLAVVCFFTSLSFSGLLLSAYILLRSKAVSAFVAALFVALVAVHPAWSQGVIGQLYSDRFFFGVGLLFAMLLDKTPLRWGWLIVVSLLCASIHERVAIICGLFSIGYSVFFWRSRRELRFRGIALGIAFMAYAFAVMKLVIQNGDYGSFSSSLSLTAITNNFQSEAFQNGLLLFFLFNIGLLGVFGFFAWPHVLLALGLMLPNVLGNMGGAEKTGWSTHYHSTYFPFLVWSSACGIVWISKRFPKRMVQGVLGIVLLGMALVSVGLDPYSRPGLFSSLSSPLSSPLWSTDQIERSGLQRVRLDFTSAVDGDVVHEALMDLQAKLRAKIPKGAVVSMPEPIMPILLGHAQQRYFPIGVPTADFIILPYVKRGSGIGYGGLVSYTTTDLDKLYAASSCLVAKMESMGFDVEHPDLLNESWALISRQPRL